jgi:hypothetical protein
MRRVHRTTAPLLALCVLLAGAACAGGAEEASPANLDGGTKEVGDGFVLDDVPALDIGDGPLVEECHIATLGVPGDAGTGDIFAKWLDKSGGKAAASLADQVLTKSLLSPYKVLVVQNVSTGHVYAPSEVAVLNDWVKAGGGLMTLTGFADPSEVVNVNGLLAPYGVSYGTTGILYGGGTTVPVTNWVPHPVTKGVTRIGIDNGYAVLGSGTTLASEGGFDVLKVKEVGSGHVLAWGDEWITFNSEWSAHPDYQVQTFWQNIVDWFAPGAHCKVPDPPK